MLCFLGIPSNLCRGSSISFWNILIGLDEVLVLFTVVAPLLAEYLVNGLGILVTYLGYFSSLFQFDLLVVDHIEQVLPLLVADASISFLVVPILFLCNFLNNVYGLGVV